MSIQLKCDATHCLYNRDRLCSAEAIEVQGGNTPSGDDTFCGTFSSKTVGNYVSSATNMNYGEAVKQMVSGEPVMDPKVLCNAVNCIYNENRLCHADSVEINNELSMSAEQTECQTFYPRQQM